MMTLIGYILFIGGFLAGALVTALDPTEMNWRWFVPAVAVGVLGVVLIRLSHRGRHRTEGAIEGNFQTAMEAIGRIGGHIETLRAEVLTLSPYAIHGRIDDLFPVEVDRFVEARHSIAHKYNLRLYSDVMSHFSAAERYLNRVWSASVDGYIDEVRIYTVKAGEQFELARTLLVGASDKVAGQ